MSCLFLIFNAFHLTLDNHIHRAGWVVATPNIKPRKEKLYRWSRQMDWLEQTSGK